MVGFNLHAIIAVVIGRDHRRNQARQTPLAHRKVRPIWITPSAFPDSSPMKQKLYVILIAFLATASAAFAGPYSDTLGKKLVSSTTSQEKALFVRWMFVAMALHPDLKDMSSITPAQREEANRAVANLMTKMLTQTCAVEAKEAVKYEGASAIEGAFNLFGQIAARELFTNKEVSGGLAELQKYFDSKAIEQALSDAKPDGSEKK